MTNYLKEFQVLCEQKFDTKKYKSLLFVRQLINIILIYLIQFFLIILLLLVFLKRLFKNEKVLPKIFIHALSRDQIYREKNTTELFHFFADKRFPYSSNPKEFLVYCKSFFLPKTSQLKVTRNISLYLIINCFSRKKIIELLKMSNCLALFIANKRSILSLRHRYLIYYFIEYCVWVNVDFKNRILFITTQSSYKNLPVPFYILNINIERHMIWYSTNSIPIYKKNEVKSKLVFSKDLQDNIDHHLVWDKMQVDFLKNQNIFNAHIYGSMLFYSRNVKSNIEKNFDLVYFDVIPQYLHENGFYNTKMALDIIENILSVLEELNDQFDLKVLLSIKHKRKVAHLHSKKYINTIQKLEALGLVRIVSHNYNLYKLINDSKFVIGVPFTSPVIVAKELKIDSAYVYLTNSEFIVPDNYNGIKVIKERNNLLSELSRFI